MKAQLSKADVLVSRNSARTLVHKKSLFRRVYDCGWLYALILPAIITVFIFHYIPLYGVQIAFKDFRNSLGIWGSEWVGFKHFIRFFNYPYFWKILRNTIWISLCSLITFPLPIVFAIMLNEMKNLKLKKVCQQLTYAPHFVSIVVLCCMVTMFTGREGLVNILLGIFGVEAKDYMADPAAFAPIYAISGSWQNLGWGTIIYLASLAGVSEELIDAAKIDGASRMQIIWNVYLPHLMPQIITLFILRMGSLLSVGFEKTFLLQNALNKDASSVISTYVYEIGLLNQNYSYSAAIGLFNSIINITIIGITNAISKKVTKTSLW